MPCMPPQWYVHAFLSYGGCSHTTSKCDITPGSTAKYRSFWSKITHMLVFCIPSFCLHQCLGPTTHRTIEGINKLLGDIDPCPLQCLPQLILALRLRISGPDDTFQLCPDMFLNIHVRTRWCRLQLSQIGLLKPALHHPAHVLPIIVMRIDGLVSWDLEVVQGAQIVVLHNISQQ